MLLNSQNTLHLVLYNKRGGEEGKKKKLNKDKSLDIDPTPGPAVSPVTGLVSAPVVLRLSTQLPLPPSPEYIALQQTRTRRRSESLSALNASEVGFIQIIFFPNLS